MCDQIHVPAALLPMEIPVSTEYKAKWVSDQDWKFWRKELSCPHRESNHDYSDFCPNVITIPIALTRCISIIKLHENSVTSSETARFPYG